MDPAVARGEAEALLGVLHGDGFLEAVLESDLHADGDRLDVVVDVFEVSADAHFFSSAELWGGWERKSIDQEGPTSFGVRGRMGGDCSKGGSTNLKPLNSAGNFWPKAMLSF